LEQWSVRTAGPAGTRALGRALGAVLEASLAVFLTGELGAGKTCFVQGLAAGLGIPAEEPVTSPTFTLVNSYRGRLVLHHFDLYRLLHPDQVEELGFEEYLLGPGVTVVEWAERLADEAREGLYVHLVYAAEQERELTFQARGAAAEVVLALLQRRWLKGEVAE
jgi:tRNA threonylcarbamoyladenosine biosynthesis protein TsaE